MSRKKKESGGKEPLAPYAIRIVAEALTLVSTQVVISRIVGSSPMSRSVLTVQMQSDLLDVTPVTVQCTTQGLVGGGPEVH